MPDLRNELDAALRGRSWGASESHGEIDPAVLDQVRAADAATAAAIRALQRIERSTMARLRRMLVSPTHTQARITAFLTTWAYERYWIDDLLTRLLRSSDHAGGRTAERSGAR